jgi:hypothetical protein
MHKPQGPVPCPLYTTRQQKATSPERSPNVFRMGVRYTGHIRELWSNGVTQEQKRSGEVAGYVSYLLRLWREKGEQTTRWRASLQDPHSGDRVGFAHLDELVAFLREQIGLAPPAEGLVRDEGTSKKDTTSLEGEQK